MSLFTRNACLFFPRATLIKPEIYRKNAAAQNHGADCVGACAVETHVKIHKSQLYTEVYRKMPRPKTTAQTLCEPAQSKRMSRFHQSHFIRKFTGKMPQPKTTVQPAQSERICQDFTRATLYGNLQEICRGPEWAPTPNVRTPQCGHTVRGNSHYNIITSIYVGPIPASWNFETQVLRWRLSRRSLLQGPTMPQPRVEPYFFWGKGFIIPDPLRHH